MKLIKPFIHYAIVALLGTIIGGALDTMHQASFMNWTFAVFGIAVAAWFHYGYLKENEK